MRGHGLRQETERVQLLLGCTALVEFYLTFQISVSKSVKWTVLRTD